MVTLLRPMWLERKIPTGLKPQFSVKELRATDTIIDKDIDEERKWHEESDRKKNPESDFILPEVPLAYEGRPFETVAKIEMVPDMCCWKWSNQTEESNPPEQAESAAAATAAQKVGRDRPDERLIRT